MHEESVRRVITRLTDERIPMAPRQRRRDPSARQRRSHAARGPVESSPEARRSCRTTSMRRAPSASPRCCTCPKLVDDMIPLNAGCLKPLDMILVQGGSMLNPGLSGGRCRQAMSRRLSCITNALYGALGVMASAAGHDEQLHLLATPVPVRRCPASSAAGVRGSERSRQRSSTAPTSCRRI